MNTLARHWLRLRERVHRMITLPTLGIYLCLAAICFGGQSGDFTYSAGPYFDSNSVCITGYTGPGGNVTLPDTINGLPVTAIGYGAFMNNLALNRVTLGKHVKFINQFAFELCYGLQEVNFGNEVERIDYGAFLGCGLTNITLPKSLKNLANVSFGSNPLINIYFLGDAPPGSYPSGGGPAFRNDAATYLPTIYYIPGTTGWGSRYEGVATAPWTTDFTFTQLSSETIEITSYIGTNQTLTIPDAIYGMKVTSIGDNAFAQLSTITNVVITEGVTNLGNRAFAECTGLSSMLLPSSLTHIGSEAFAGCSQLTELYFKGNAPVLEAGSFTNTVSNLAVFYFSANTGFSSPWGGGASQHLGGTGAFCLFHEQHRHYFSYWL